MTPKVRRILMWSGLFVLALVGGILVGRFTVSGVFKGDRIVQRDSDAGNFWAAQDRTRAAQAAAPPKPVDRFVMGRPESHDCEGCDATTGRERQIAAEIGAHYSMSASLPGAANADPTGATVPPPPPAPPQ